MGDLLGMKGLNAQQTDVDWHRVDFFEGGKGVTQSENLKSSWDSWKYSPHARAMVELQ